MVSTTREIISEKTCDDVFLHSFSTPDYNVPRDYFSSPRFFLWNENNGTTSSLSSTIKLGCVCLSYHSSCRSKWRLNSNRRWRSPVGAFAVPYSIARMVRQYSWVTAIAPIAGVRAEQAILLQSRCPIQRLRRLARRPISSRRRTAARRFATRSARSVPRRSTRTRQVYPASH